MIKMTHRTRLVLLGILLFFVVSSYSYMAGDLEPPEAVKKVIELPFAEMPASLPPSESKQAKSATHTPPQAKKQSKLVDVYMISAHALADHVEVLGTAQANESVDVGSTVTETIREIFFSDGEYVLQGNRLALLEQSEEQAQLRAAELQLKEHERELERLYRLLRSKATSKRTVDERETLVEIAKQHIDEIKARIADRTIVAPFDGVLGIRQVSVGALVSAGDIITTIDDIHRIKLDFYVPSVFLPELRSGNAIKAHVEALNNRVFEGKIDVINTRVDPVTRSVLVRAILPNPDLLLKPGLLMKINLIRNEREALVVPEEALIQRKNRFFVLVVGEDNIIEEREVAVGTHYPAKMEVISGLEIDEKVVVRGIHTVRKGQEVSVNEVWKEIREPITGGL